jgi:hypothetical protein
MPRKISEDQTRKQMIEKHQSFRPFGFLANGLEIHFVDVGIAHKREVSKIGYSIIEHFVSRSKPYGR